MVLRHYGWKECVYRLAIAGSIGLAINLPFILWNPQAWLAGILAPVVDPMFPMGVGLVNLSATHLIPFLPKWAYTALEGMTMLAALVWYWRICKRIPEAAMLLAVLPLFFAWRSLASYFYCAAYPLLILMAARTNTREKVRPLEQQSLSMEFAASHVESPMPAIPAVIGFQQTSYSAPLFHYRTSFRL